MKDTRKLPDRTLIKVEFAKEAWFCTTVFDFALPGEGQSFKINCSVVLYLVLLSHDRLNDTSLPSFLSCRSTCEQRRQLFPHSSAHPKPHHSAPQFHSSAPYARSHLASSLPLRVSSPSPLLGDSGGGIAYDHNQRWLTNGSAQRPRSHTDVAQAAGVLMHRPLR